MIYWNVVWVWGFCMFTSNASHSSNQSVAKLWGLDCSQSWNTSGVIFLIINISSLLSTCHVLWALVFRLFDWTSCFLNTNQLASLFTCPIELCKLFSQAALYFWIMTHFISISNVLLFDRQGKWGGDVSLCVNDQLDFIELCLGWMWSWLRAYCSGLKGQVTL